MNMLNKTLFAVALVAALAFGCASTITPPQASPSVASWDGTNQNSGLIVFINGGAVVTQHWHDRYVYLRTTYGARNKPPVMDDTGLTRLPDGTWFVDAQRHAYFATWDRWSKQPK